MDGPGGNLPRRRAGDSGPSEHPGGVRDWQRNTWYGPAPVDPNPFDEPDEAPELLELRSENVREKSGDFWQEQKEQTGYISTAGARRRRAAEKQNRKQKSGKLSVFFLKVLGIVILIAIIVVSILFFGVYRIREIRVEGNDRISAGDVITLSGIRKGDSILTLNEEKISERLISGAKSRGKDNQNYFLLEFRYIKREMPGTVIIAVKEKEPCCWVDLRGIIYVLDKQRSVIWEIHDREQAPSNLVEVKGLKVKSGSRAGQTLVMESSVQQRIFDDLFLEMKVIEYRDENETDETRKNKPIYHLIREIDLGNAVRDKDPVVLMETRAGYVVNMGDCRSSRPEENRIHAKLRALLLVQEELIRMGKTGGTIDVKTPESPYYAETSGV